MESDCKRAAFRIQFQPVPMAIVAPAGHTSHAVDGNDRLVHWQDALDTQRH